MLASRDYLVGMENVRDERRKGGKELWKHPQQTSQHRSCGWCSCISCCCCSCRTDDDHASAIEYSESHAALSLVRLVLHLTTGRRTDKDTWAYIRHLRITRDLTRHRRHHRYVRNEAEHLRMGSRLRIIGETGQLRHTHQFRLSIMSVSISYSNLFRT